MRMSIIVLFIALVFSASAIGQKVEGVWSLTEITTTGDKGTTRQMTQPSMYLFTKKHYSIIYVSSSDPRADMDLAAATADDLRNIFVNSFVANAGTYEIKAGKITMHPMVAKAPSFMKAGTFTTSSVKIDGNMMTLVSESNNNGPTANPQTTKLKRIE